MAGPLSLQTVSIAAVVLAVGALSSQPRSEARAATTGRQRPAQRLVYQTNWHHGIRKWTQAITGWRGPDDGGKWMGVDAVLVFEPGNVDGVGMILAPVVPKGHYAVEATIRDDGANGWGSGNDCFGLVARTQGVDVYGQGVAIAGGYQHDSQQAQLGELTWHGIDGVFGGRAFIAGRRYHTYRLEVRGINYRLLVDGKRMASGHDVNFLDQTAVGIFSEDMAIDVKVFKIFSL